MDMIVTATSGAGKKILDIMKVKPGCVITDVARPLDLPPEEVAKRPDVLVIESGEIQLPGKVSMKNIGLPKNVAYACLAETIVLALEGRFENFTVGRNIEWEKVREIYRLGPQARHEAGRDLGRQRAVLRRRHPPRAQARAGRAGHPRQRRWFGEARQARQGHHSRQGRHSRQGHHRVKVATTAKQRPRNRRDRRDLEAREARRQGNAPEARRRPARQGRAGRREEVGPPRGAGQPARALSVDSGSNSGSSSRLRPGSAAASGLAACIVARQRRVRSW